MSLERVVPVPVAHDVGDFLPREAEPPRAWAARRIAEDTLRAYVLHVSALAEEV